MKYDTILIQAAVGPQQVNLLNLSCNIHQEYCGRKKYTYWPLRYVAVETVSIGLFDSHRDRRERTLGYRHPAWIKIALMEIALQQYDNVIWLDNDCLIVDMEAELTNAITVLSPEKRAVSADSIAILHEPGSVFSGGGSTGVVLSRNYDPPRYNTGAIYVRSCPQSARLFSAVWHMGDNKNYGGWEEEAFNDYVGSKAGIDAGVVEIGSKWNCSHLHFPPTEDVVVKSWHGMSLEEKFTRMSKELKNVA